MSQHGVLLVNLGSPDSPSVPDVRRYLREFLMDGRVLDTPWPIRFLVVHAFILPFRPKQSAEAYRKVWLPEGSPLVVISRRVQARLQQRVNLPVELAMRYRNPSIEHALRALAARGVDDLLLIPLFPQFAMSSYETAVLRVQTLARGLIPQLRLTVQPPYYDHPDYVRALVASAEPHLEGTYDHLLFSFHGLPERHMRKADPTSAHCLKHPRCCETPSRAHPTCYRHQCFRTVEAFLAATKIPRHSIAFQSRLGRDPWLRPYTDHEIVRLAQGGVRRLRVICPAFVSDCLETIEEIGMRAQDTFREAGGQDFRMIPCLNEHPLWISALENMIVRFAPAAAAATAQRRK